MQKERKRKRSRELGRKKEKKRKKHRERGTMVIFEGVTKGRCGEELVHV